MNTADSRYSKDLRFGVEWEMKTKVRGCKVRSETVKLKCSQPEHLPRLMTQAAAQNHGMVCSSFLGLRCIHLVDLSLPRKQRLSSYPAFLDRPTLCDLLPDLPRCCPWPVL